MSARFFRPFQVSPCSLSVMPVFSVVLITLVLVIGSARVSAETLDISLMVFSAEQRSVFLELGHRFERAHPGATIRWLAESEDTYKRNLRSWLADPDGPDLLYWQAGERLRQIAETGRIAPLGTVWRNARLNIVIPRKIRKSVTYNDQIYALPYSFYQWGFYYRSSLFEKLELQPPENWQELLNVCGKLNRHGVYPIAIGNRHSWPAAAWFDYLDLRLNGIAFHKAVLDGDISFLDSRVRAVFEHWKTLLDQQCFTPVDQQIDSTWRDSLPLLYHNRAGMMLMGNFLTSQLPAAMEDDIRFFPFPEIRDEVGRFEEAPTDVFMLARHAANNKSARAFLRFLSTPEIQSRLNNRTGKISVNAAAPIANDYFLQQGARLLGGADGLTQYFDRDAPKALADPAMGVFRDFMASRNIDKTLEQLEAIRGSL